MANYFKHKEGEEFCGADTDTIIDYNAGEAYIQIVYKQELGDNYFKEPVIQSAEKVTVFEIEPFEGGGGGDGAPHFANWLHDPLVSFIIGSISGGFFEEIGKELLQSMFKKLKGLKGTTTINVYGPNYEVKLLAPAELSEKDCQIIMLKLDKFISSIRQNEEHESFFIIYDKERGDLLLFEKTL